jgi:microsomal dipeptidase-like Zn-dependent dipeptidase
MEGMVWIGGGTGDVATSNYGAPVFSSWPVWSTAIHQQSYYKWLERAWRGGLRTVVMFAVTNAALCKSTTHIRDKNGVTPKVDCNDSMTPLKEQIKAAYLFEAFIQKNHPDKWFKIVKTAAEARQVVKDGKLAVVLGIEVDNLFNCKLKANECLGVNLDRDIDEIYKLGVRHVFPIHNFENGFGAPATWQNPIEVGNVVIEGSWWQTEECPTGTELGSGYGFKAVPDFKSTATALIGLGTVPPLAPQRPEKASCNKNGLSSLGKSLVKKLMDKGIIVDVDHMSNKSFDDTVKLSNARLYPAPLVASHVQFFDLNTKDITHERMRTNQQLAAIRKTGGMIAAMLKDDSLDVPERLGMKKNLPYRSTRIKSPVEDNCRHSSRVFAHMLQYAVDTMGGPVAMGSDFNGLAGHFAPRFGNQACGGDKTEQAAQTKKMEYPFTFRGFGTFDRQKTGDKTFDYNFDGMAHIGLLPDFVQDLETVGLEERYLRNLFQSADAYVDVMERAEKSAGTLRPNYCGRLGQESCNLNGITPCETGLTDFRGRCSKLQ